MIRPITFDEQIARAKDDGGVYRNIYPHDGLLWGCAVTTTSTQIEIASGLLTLCGRMIWVDGKTDFPLQEPIQNGYAQLKAKIDLNNANTQEECAQFATEVVYSTTASFPELIQEDINNTGKKYEQELAVVKIENGNITGITRKLVNAGVDAEKLGGIAAEKTLQYRELAPPDLNDAKTGGAYILGGDSPFANAPERYGVLLVFGEAQFRVGQIIIGATGKIYLRLNSNDAWTEWYDVKGNTDSKMSITGGTFTGAVTAPDFISKGTVTAKIVNVSDVNGLQFTNNGNNWSQILSYKTLALRNRGVTGTKINIDAANCAAPSSIRYKENIQNVTEEDAVKPLHLRPIIHDWKKGSGYEDRGNAKSFIAEEAAEVDERYIYRTAHIILPEISHMDEETGKYIIDRPAEYEMRIEGLNQNAILCDTVALCQRQQKQIDALEGRIMELEKAAAILDK